MAWIFTAPTRPGKLFNRAELEFGHFPQATGRRRQTVALRELRPMIYIRAMVQLIGHYDIELDLV
jgi:hypothetical protein